MNKKEIYLSLTLLALAFVILLTTLLPYHRENPTPSPSIISQPSAIPTPSFSPIIILSPNISKPLTSPLKLIGLIDKSWVFEGSFPIELLDNQNKSLFKSTASAPNWLEEESKYTSFMAVFNFVTYSPSGFVQVKNSNPSGLPENDKRVTIPVTFDSTSVTKTGLKTYKNNQYGFEFEIPIDWEAKEKPPYHTYFGKIGESYYNEGSVSDGEIVISVEKKNPNENLETIFKSYYDGFLKNSDTTIQKIKLGGIDAGYFDYFDETAFTIKDNYRITIQVTAYPQIDPSVYSKDIFQQILSTFKFTK
ncbi:MAG TPA: hypothetical protein VN174_00380 [Candidatus Methanoperedens sp.]|nr:hypothetical protein [Candidatus Methanoperedens sp.]